MAIKINCLLSNTPYYEDIKSAIMYFANEMLDNDKQPTVQALYNKARKGGVEIDKNSFAYAYNQAFGQADDTAFSTTDEVNEWAGEEYKKLLKETVDAALGEAPKQKEIGSLSPEQSVVKTIAKLFSMNSTDAAPATKTIMREMQDIMTKWAKSKTESKSKATPSIFETLTDFFNLQEKGFETLQGTINNLETLHFEIKKSIREFVKDLDAAATDKMTEIEKEQLIDSYDEYTKELMNSVYDIVLSKGEQARLLNEMLKQEGLVIGDGNFLDKNGNISWSKVGGENGDPKLVKAKVKELLMDGVKDEQGKTVKYNEQQATQLAEYFERIYTKKRNDVIENRINKANTPIAKNPKAAIIASFMDSLEWGQLVEQFKIDALNNNNATISDLKDKLEEYINNDPMLSVLPESYKKEVIDKFEKIATAKGQPNKTLLKNTKATIISSFIQSLGEFKISRNAKGDDITTTDWKRLINKFRTDALNNNQATVNDLRTRLAEYINSDTKLSTLPKSYINEVLTQFEKIALAKMKGKAAKRTAIDKLMNFADLNKGNAFNAETNAALLETLDISEIDQETLVRVQALAQAMSQLNKGGLSPTSMQYLQDFIHFNTQKLVTKNIRNKSFLASFLNAIGANLKAIATSFLIAPISISENITTSLGTSLGQTAALAKRGQFGTQSVLEYFRGFLTGAFDIGEANMDYDRIIRNTLPSSDSYNIATFLKSYANLFTEPSWQKGGEAFLQTIGSVAAVVNSLGKVVLNAFDNAAVSAMFYKGTMIGLYDNVEKYYGKDEAMRVLKGVKGMKNNQVVQDYIDANLPTLIATVEQGLGKKLNVLQRANIKSDLKRKAIEIVLMDSNLPNMTEDLAALIVNDAIISGMKMAKIFNGKQNMIQEGVLGAPTNSLYKGAEALRAVPTTLYERGEKNIKEGKVLKGSTIQLAGDYSSFFSGLFAYGISRFLVLGKTAIPGVGLMDYYGTRSALKDLEAKNPLLKSKDAAQRQNIDATERQKYDAAKQQSEQILIRQLGGFVLLAAMVALKAVKPPEEDENYWDKIFDRLMETREGRKIVRRLLTIPMSAIEYGEKVKEQSENYYGSKSENYREAEKIALEYLENTVTQDNSQSLPIEIISAMKYAKSGQKSEAAQRAFMNKLFPSYDINFDEKITKTMNTLNGVISGDLQMNKLNEETQKEIYRAINTGEGFYWFANEWLRLGLFESATRRKEKGILDNRFAEPKK